MRKSIIYYLIAIPIVLLVCVYFIRTTNFYLGSNGYYYKDIFDYPESEWVCEEPKIKLRVYNLKQHPQSEMEYVGYPHVAIMKMEFSEGEKEYAMIGERGHVEIYEPIYVAGKIIDKFEVFNGHANYRKNFFSAEVTSFTIYDIVQDEIFHHSYEKLRFHRK